MKLTILLLIIAGLQVSAKTYAQDKITLSEKDASIQAVLKEVSRQTGYKYIITQQWADKMKPITIEAKNVPLQQVLDKVFEGQPYTYIIVSSTIIVKEREASGQSPVTPPTKEIKGKVINEKGEPLAGAAVYVKGTNRGTSTDDNGEFRLKGIREEDIIEIRSIGYNDTSNAAANKTYFVIQLSVNIATLGEAVITAPISSGYQKIPAERATGSFAFVDNQLLNRKVSMNVLDRLEGIVPGLLVNRNAGTANAPNGIDISIRGYSTLFANGQPLIVVDNFPYDGNIQNINANDVENITILRDAAAASIWGVQSGNGVIVITTKKGARNQKMSIDVNANFTVAEKPNVFYNPNYLSSPAFIDVEKSLFQNGFYDGTLTDPNRLVVSPVVQILADQRSGLITQGQADAQISALSKVDMRDQLSKYFYRKGTTQQYSVGLRGGGDKNDYYFSFGYDKNLDGQVGNSNDRLNINSLSHFYPVKHLTLTAGIAYTHSKMVNNSPVGNLTSGLGTLALYPYAQFADASGKPLAIVRDYNYSWVADSLTNSKLLNWQFKPLDELRFADNNTYNNNIKLNFGAKYEFPLGLSLEMNYQFDRSAVNTGNYYSDSTYYTRNLINQYTDFSLSNPYPIPVAGIMRESDATATTHRLRGQLNFSRAWDRKHLVAAIAGAEVSEQVVESNSHTLYGFDKNTGSTQAVDYINSFQLYPYSYSARIPYGDFYDNATNRYVSYFSNLSYTFNGRYTISGSARIDKSNLLGVSTNQKSVPLYSAGVAWDIGKESFYKVSFLPYLKLRASYGYNGNINKSATAVQTINQVNNNTWYGLPFAVVSNPGNPSLRWEKIRIINFGLDFRTKNNFLDATVEYYLKRGIDLFGNSPLPPSTGMSQFFGNTADIKGHGLDISFRFRWLRHSSPLQWETIFLVSSAFDQVMKYHDLASSTSSYINLTPANTSGILPVEGKPIFSVFSYRWAGLSHDKGDPQGYLGGKASIDYASIIGKTTIDSLVFHGSGRPTKYGSIRNTWTFKGVSLSANIVYKLGYYFRRSSIQYNTLYYTWAGHEDFYKRWMKPGDEAFTNVPSMPAVPSSDENNRGNFYSNSEVLVDKGDHIRLQDISLSYSLDLRKYFGGKFNPLTVYFYVNNVGILWRANKDGLDPDIPPSFAVTGVSLPASRTYSFGLKTNF